MTGDCRALAGGTNALGCAMLQRLSADEKQSNVLISPLSIALCLTMVQIGAARQTRDQMAQLLGVTRLGEGASDKAASALTASLRAADEIELRIANSLWVN